MRVAILDLGSNSFHLVVYDIMHDMHFSVVCRRSHGNMISREEYQSGRSGEDAFKNAIAAVNDLVCHARASDSEYIGCFATGIFRDYPKASAFFDALRVQCGITIELLSPEEEGKTVFAGIRNFYTWAHEYCILDIGGGSTECVSVSGGNVRWIKSVPLGTVSLGRMCRQGKTERGWEKKKKVVLARFEELFSAACQETYRVCFGVSGLFRNVASCIATHAHDVGCYNLYPPCVTYQEIAGIAEIMCLKNDSLNSRESYSMIEMGTAVLLAFMKRSSLSSVYVSDISSREGYLYRCFETGAITMR